MSINNLKKASGLLVFLSLLGLVGTFGYFYYVNSSFKLNAEQEKILYSAGALTLFFIVLNLLFFFLERAKKSKALDLVDPEMRSAETALVENNDSFNVIDKKEDLKADNPKEKTIYEAGPETVEKEGLPIKILIGYQPEVLARDAKEYAIGLAQKHFSDLGLAYWGVFEYENGFIFEIHEGGPGKAYGPEIIKFFQEQGVFDNSKQNELRIKTASRILQIIRKERGIAGILLPENSTKEDSGLVPIVKLEPCIDRRTKMLKFSSMVAVSGILALFVCGSLFRLQPFEEIKEIEQKVSSGNLPIVQWNRIVLGPSEYLKALKFKEGKWSHDKAFEGAPPTPENTPSNSQGALQ